MTTPNPGSREAVAQGCTCPRMDNSHGRGYMGGVKDPETGETIFVYTVGCPVHEATRPTTNEPSGTSSPRNEIGEEG